MDKKLVDKWIDRFDRVLTIIRPKAYNLIARSVIGLGVILVAESQLNLVQAIVIATYESFFGYSEVLREFIDSSSSPWLGVSLILIGLTYHYFMTVGKEQIELRQAGLAKPPKIVLSLLNADYEPYEDEIISLRGHTVDTPPENEIPKYKINFSIPNMEGVNSFINTVGNMDKNPYFYKERGSLLKVWGGAELLRLKVANDGDALATGVGVELKFPRVNGVSAENILDDIPTIPSEESKDGFGSISIVSLSNNHSVHYDITRAHTDTHYCFFWTINDIQANTDTTSDTCVFLRSEHDITLELTVYCDQFSAPLKRLFTIQKPISRVEVTISELMADDESYKDIVNRHIMDGYIQRSAERKFAQYEHESQQIIP